MIMIWMKITQNPLNFNLKKKNKKRIKKKEIENYFRKNFIASQRFSTDRRHKMQCYIHIHTILLTLLQLYIQLTSFSNTHILWYCVFVRYAFYRDKFLIKY